MARDSKRRGDICHQVNDIKPHSMTYDSKRVVTYAIN